jgi:hypothetical protein
MDVTGTRLFAVLRLEYATEEVDRLIERVDCGRRIHVGPHRVHHLLASRCEARPGQEIAEKGEHLPSDAAPSNEICSNVNVYAPKVVNVDLRRQSSGKTSA